MRTDSRPPNALRPITIQRRFTQTPAGSVLWRQGKTIVLCTASVTNSTPPWFPESRAGGWVTAEYVMLPASTPQRKPWPTTGHTDSRGTEIQRLIGRSLRAVLDLSKIGPHTIAIDCQVLQADGGTRTAAICAAYVALVDALRALPRDFPAPKISPSHSATAPRFNPSLYSPDTALADSLAAVSVGIIDNEIRLDLDYADDSRAAVDMNIAMTGAGRFIEVQGAAENGAESGFDRATLNRMLDLAQQGCLQLFALQKNALEQP